MKQLIPGVYQVPIGPSAVNFYVFDTGSGLAVVDFGASPGHLERLSKGLADHTLSIDDVRYALVTHGHSDHIGALAALQQRQTVITYAHTSDAPIIRGQAAYQYANPAQLGFVGKLLAPTLPSMAPIPAQVDIEVTDGDVLDDVMPGLTVVHLPGHTYGQVGYWLPQQRTLFAGDAMGHVFGRLYQWLRFVSPDWDAGKVSIRKLAALEPDVVCLGHGAPLVGRDEVSRKLANLLERL